MRSQRGQAMGITAKRACGAALTRSPLAPRRSWLGALAGLVGAAMALVVTSSIGPAASARAEEPMTFHMTTITGRSGCPRNCAEVISAEGEIDNETAEHFLAFLADHLRERDLRPVVLLESPGGTVVGAMQLGAVFRNIHAAVIVAAARGDDGEGAHVVPGACLSACVYAFIGGARRVVPPVSRLGIHRMVINEQVRDGSGGYATQQIFGSTDIVSSLAAYTRAMGVDPHMIGYAETIAPDRLHIVTPREIVRWRLGQPRL